MLEEIAQHDAGLNSNSECRPTTPTTNPLTEFHPYPTTPTSNPPADSESFTHTTPSKTTNANGKRPMQPSEGAAVRRGEHLTNVRAALEAWRYTTKRTQHTLGSVMAEVVMPGPILTTLASNARI